MLLSSCTTYKKIPEGEHLVVANKYDINGKKRYSPEFSPYIRQAPNKKVLFFFPVKMDLYNTAREDPQQVFDRWKENKKGTVAILTALFSEKGMDRLDSTYVNYNRTLKKLGEAPVLYDPTWPPAR